MNVTNCKQCGRLFNYMSGPRLCQACQSELEDKFQIVKQYLWEHPDAPMNRVAEDNEVSVKQLKQWVREERLVLSDDSPVFIECENCGAPIKTGRFCDNCKSKLQSSLSSAIDKKKPEENKKNNNKDGNKMRFLDL